MKLRAYIETTIPSYLTAWPSGSLIRAAEQHQTKLWWLQRDQYELVGSELLIEECSRGDALAAATRLHALEGIPLLESNEQSNTLLLELIREVPFPPKAVPDANHLALATVHGIDLLVTWNMRHIANPVLQKRVEQVCRLLGYEPPTITTPGMLLGGNSDDRR